MKLFINCILVTFGTFLGLFAGEIILRTLGRSTGTVPAPYEPANFSYHDPFTENPKTGWKLKPGNYMLSLGGSGRLTSISINQDFSRATSKENLSSIPTTSKIVFFGDSYIFGEGLNDNETLPWQTQLFFPNKKVINHGVGGYGTCQTALRLDQLKNILAHKDIVIYGLNEFHEERNTADPRYDYWIAITSPSHQSNYPKCKLVNNSLVIESTRTWNIIMPLTGKSVVSKAITDMWLSTQAITSIRQQREVTTALIQNMSQLIKERNAIFVVLLLELQADSLIHYKKLLKDLNISYIDGSTVAARSDLKLPDGHPGPEMTKAWANQLMHFISSDIK